MANLYCDNYTSCNSYAVDRGSTEQTETYARARGWHIFHGEDYGGKEHHAVLCHHCVDAKRRKLDPAPPLQPGQQELIGFSVIIESAP